MHKLSEVADWLLHINAVAMALHEYSSRLHEAQVRQQHAESLSMPRIAYRWQTEQEFARTAYLVAVRELQEQTQVDEADAIDQVIARVQARYEEAVLCRDRLERSQAVLERVTTNPDLYTVEEVDAAIADYRKHTEAEETAVALCFQSIPARA
jgi:hypothetical protein